MIDMKTLKTIALAKHLEIHPEEVGYPSWSIENYHVSNQGYLVLTDEEADKREDNYLENYIDECIFSRIKDGTAKRYFDRESWKRDTKQNGRGASLAPYDGEENYEDLPTIPEEVYNWSDGPFILEQATWILNNLDDEEAEEAAVILHDALHDVGMRCESFTEKEFFKAIINMEPWALHMLQEQVSGEVETLYIYRIV